MPNEVHCRDLSEGIERPQKIEHQSAVRIIKKIRIMENDLSGDVKRLTDFDVGYRLRVGDFRVLFDVRSDVLVIRRIKHRSEAY